MDLVEFQSSENGLYVVVPEDTEIQTNDGEDLILQGETATVTLHYFDASETDEDEITDMLNEMLESTSVDFDDADEDTIETETLAGSMLTAANDDLVAVAGVLYAKEDDEIGFVYCIMTSADDAELAGQIVSSIEFNSDEIEDEE